MTPRGQKETPAEAGDPHAILDLTAAGAGPVVALVGSELSELGLLGFGAFDNEEAVAILGGGVDVDCVGGDFDDG